MATWNDYKRRVRESNPDITKDIDEIEKRSQAYSRDEIPNTETVAALSEYHEMKNIPKKYKRYGDRPIICVNLLRGVE